MAESVSNQGFASKKCYNGISRFVFHLHHKLSHSQRNITSRGCRLLVFRLTKSMKMPFAPRKPASKPTSTGYTLAKALGWTWSMAARGSSKKLRTECPKIVRPSSRSRMIWLCPTWVLPSRNGNPPMFFVSVSELQHMEFTNIYNRTLETYSCTQSLSLSLSLALSLRRPRICFFFGGGPCSIIFWMIDWVGPHKGPLPI